MISKAFFFVALLATAINWDVAESRKQNRAMMTKEKPGKGRQFSLFNIVNFSNGGCASTSSSSGSASGFRNGTCYTSNECTSKGGTSAGSCAAGFGVCCVFTKSTTGDQIDQNCTYIQNPGFPSTTTETTMVTYTIQKSSSDVCWLRLDFDTFTIQGTGSTASESDGGVCLDDLTITTSNPGSIPVICGSNQGQHIYVDVGKGSSDTATLTFNFESGTTNPRSWEIKATQVECYSKSAPPDCCLQYFTGLTGRFETFNYNNPGSGETHLANQDYSACIRQECGYCCIQYQLCDPTSFTIDVDNMPDTDKPGLDTNCSSDYIGIPESDISCSSTTGASSAPLYNRFCTDTFGGQMAPVPICDCTPPFLIDVYTDTAADDGTNAAMNTGRSQGACITWEQLPC